MDLTSSYINKARAILDKVEDQKDLIRQAASWFSDSILAGRMVHLFGSGHSRIMVEEMWPRYGSFPGFNPIVELSLTFHNPVVGSNGQRQSMFLENVSGLAAKILRNFDLRDEDSALVISSGGCGLVAIEIAEIFQSKNIRVVSLISQEHSDANRSNREDGLKLGDFSDMVLDTGAQAGDAMIDVEGLETPVSPGSSLGGVVVVNALKAQVAHNLTAAGHPPPVITAACLVGKEKSESLFEAAYDEHARRLAKLYENIGRS